MSDERYSRLQPFSIEDRVRLSSEALNCFSPMKNDEVCAVIDKPLTPGRAVPLTGNDFLKYLTKTGKLPEAERYRQRINELLSQLARAHLLTDMGARSVLDSYYYFIRELTTLERQNVLWLAPALGPEFILHGFRNAIVQIRGKNRDGDVRAATGLMIDQTGS
jgi:hypothetical protein